MDSAGGQVLAKGTSLMLAAASTPQHMQSSCKAAAHAPNNLMHHPRLPNRTKAWPVKGEHGQAASIRQRLLNVPPGEGAASKRVDQHNASAAAAAAAAAVVALRQNALALLMASQSNWRLEPRYSQSMTSGVRAALSRPPLSTPQQYATRTSGSASL